MPRQSLVTLGYTFLITSSILATVHPYSKRQDSLLGALESSLR